MVNPRDVARNVEKKSNSLQETQWAGVLVAPDSIMAQSSVSLLLKIIEQIRKYVWNKISEMLVFERIHSESGLRARNLRWWFGNRYSPIVVKEQIFSDSSLRKKYSLIVVSDQIFLDSISEEL